MKTYRFTLIELLTVITVIIILISILLPSLAKVKTLSKSINCLNNLKQLGIAACYYQNDNQEYFMPHMMPGRRWTNLFLDEKYSSGKTMLCPSVKNIYASQYINNAVPHSSDASAKPDYGYNSFYLADAPGYGKTTEEALIILKIFQVKRPSLVICMSDDYDAGATYYSNGDAYLRPYYKADSNGQFDARHQSSVNILWTDGHVLDKRSRFGHGPYNSSDMGPYSELTEFLKNTN